MLDRRMTIFVAIMLVFLFVAGLGGYYYLKIVKPNEALQTSQTQNNGAKSTSANSQAQNEASKDEVQQNSSEPTGISKPNYVAAPQPPTK